MGFYQLQLGASFSVKHLKGKAITITQRAPDCDALHFCPAKAPGQIAAPAPISKVFIIGSSLGSISAVALVGDTITAHHICHIVPKDLTNQTAVALTIAQALHHLHPVSGGIVRAEIYGSAVNLGAIVRPADAVKLTSTSLLQCLLTDAAGLGALVGLCFGHKGFSLSDPSNQS